MNKINTIVQTIQKKRDYLEKKLKNKSEYYLKNYRKQESIEKEILNFEAVYYYTAYDIKQIDLDIVQGEVLLKSTDEPRVKITLQAKTWQNTTEWDNAEDYFFKEAILDTNNKILEVKIPTAHITSKMIIEIPSKHYENISLVIKNGNLEIDNLTCDYLFTKVLNGHFKCQNVFASSSNFTVSNGNVYANQNDFKNIDIQASNGQVNFLGKAYKFNSKVVNGSILVDNEKNNIKSLVCYTNNGHIDVLLNKRLEFYCQAETRNGQIKHNLENYITKNNELNFVVQNIEWQTNDNVEANLKLHTKNGDIKFARKD